MRFRWSGWLIGMLAFNWNPVAAAPVTLAGNVVDFSFKAKAPGKLGQPVLSEVADGSGLAFSPSNFEVHSKKLGHTINKTIRIDIKADDGFVIDGFNLSQLGEYGVAQGGRGSIFSKVRVVDHTNKDQRFTLKDRDRFNSGEGEWNQILDGSDQLDKPSSWITLFITEEIKAKGKRKQESWASLNSLNLNVKMLTSAGGPVTSVPIPAMVWLFGFSVAGLLGAPHRRSALKKKSAC
ncbi:MAG: hypothetical protein FIA97_11495 [Methylococcaceae bacterium]|nr:hypothetical protein [Methylococcaceae bacterium]